jgi:glycine/D-amino acid oxidase-like deaminating enzyme
MLQDGHPIIGFLGPGLYVAVMHSGATLGPLTGRLAAAEITGTASAEQLEQMRPYRPDRSFGPDMAYSGD